MINLQSFQKTIIPLYFMPMFINLFLIFRVVNLTFFLYWCCPIQFFGLSTTVVHKIDAKQHISADFFLNFVKSKTSANYFLMKINTGYFGVPKQVYHNTPYSHLDSSRASSLQSVPTFTHSLHSSNSIIRPENGSQVFIVRDVSRNNLTNSQASQLQAKSKLVPNQYYSKSSTAQDLIIQLQQKVEEITKKVNKNTEEIKIMKNKQKQNTFHLELQRKFSDDIEKMQQMQATHNQECLLKIVKIKEEMFETATKANRHETECIQKLNTKIDEKLLLKVRNLIEERVKQETAKIRLIIQNETNKLVHDLKWEFSKDSVANPIKSKLKYPFKPIKLSFNEFMEVALVTNGSKGRMSTRESSQSPRSGRCVFNEERTYFIDKDGYLLDEDNYYLLDQNENMIRINQTMLSQLRKEGVLKQ